MSNTATPPGSDSESDFSESDITEFATSYRRFLDAMRRAADQHNTELTEIGELVQAHLGVPLVDVDPVVEEFPMHQAVDLDVALAEVVERAGGRMICISGPMAHGVESFGEFLDRSHWDFRAGAVSYLRLPTGPRSDRRVVNCGIGLITYGSVPVAWLQRAANSRFGREKYTLELMSPDPETVNRLLTEIRTAMERGTVLRGQVISLQNNPFDYYAPGENLAFLPRPEVTADQVVLPDGVLDKIVGHVVGIGEHRDRLLAAGQHLKRGVLLYGPPGTGKTHLIRHLISRTPGTTVVMLSGRTLGLIGLAARLARVAQPAVVVLEDCDLIAEERGGDSNAALFETLEAMDGLAGDADVTFILTTNRPDLLERALAERPGRVDLAVHIDRPDLAGRRRLLELYAAELLTAGQLTMAAVEDTAERTEGITASFVKELVRRVVISAARAGRDVTDDDLREAAEGMLSDAELFTRVLLGGADGPVYADEDGDGARGFLAVPGLAPGASDTGTAWRMGFDEP